MKFEMWSWVHIVFMISPVVFIILFQLLSKNKDSKFKRKLGVIVSIIAIVILVLRNIEILFKENNRALAFAEVIPLQICHLANFFLLYAFLSNKKKIFSLLFVFFLPAAIVAILFANGLTNYASIINFRGAAYLFGHSLIVSLVIYAFINDFIVISYKTLLKSLGMLVGFYVIIHIINNLLHYANLDPNYFYSIRPERGTPLSIFYNWGNSVTGIIRFGKFETNPLYLLSLCGLGIVVGHLFYLVLRLFYFTKTKLNKRLHK